MGNKQSRSSKLPTFKKQNWHMVATPRLARPQYGLYYLFRNNLTNQQVEEYQIYFHNSGEYQKYLQFFQWRQREDCIVNTKFINSEEVKEFCNTNHNAKIYIEHIPVRLSHIEDIPYPQNLYVLFSALDGFEKIFFWVGYFQPTEDMVCVDGDGKVKVWLNPDLSKCHTCDSQFTDQSTYYRAVPHYEEQMVSEIISLVEQNTSEQIEAGMTFTQHLWHTRKGKKLNFKEAKQEIIQYAKKNNTQIPNYFESVMGIFQEQKPSELEHEEPSVKQQISQRARYEENKIFEQNRTLNQRERIHSQHWTVNQTENMPQESIIVGSMRHKPEGRASFHQRPKTQQEHLPYFSMLPPQNQSQFRSTSPSMNKQPFVQNNGPFQVKFNYQPNQSIGGPQVMSSLFREPMRQDSPVPVYLASPQPHPQPQPQLQPQPYPNPLSPIQLLPSSGQVRSDFNLEASEPQEPVSREVNANKLVYSDTTDTYELDDEIAKDIMKYFGPQHA